MLDGWRFNQNFKRHQKAMDFFRLSHIKMPESAPVKPAVDFPEQPVVQAAGPAGTANQFTDDKGRIIVVPIWNVEMPAGSKN
jgi:hypothetical protein